MFGTFRLFVGEESIRPRAGTASTRPMEERIDLREPELVPMRPEERREAVRLLAALIRADRSPKPSADANRVAESFPVGPATVETESGGRQGVA